MHDANRVRPGVEDGGRLPDGAQHARPLVGRRRRCDGGRPRGRAVACGCSATPTPDRPTPRPCSPATPFSATASPSRRGGASSSGSVASPRAACADYIPRPGTRRVVLADGRRRRPSEQRRAVERDARGRLARRSPATAWKVVRNEILTLDLRSLAFRSAAPMPSRRGLLWGTSMIDVGGTIYIYASKPRRPVRGPHDDGAPVRRPVVVLNGTTWNDQPLPSNPMRFRDRDGAPDTGPVPAGDRRAYGSGYLASAKRCDILCDDLTRGTRRPPRSVARGQRATRAGADHRRCATSSTYGGHMVPSRARLARRVERQPHQRLDG